MSFYLKFQLLVSNKWVEKYFIFFSRKSMIEKIFQNDHLIWKKKLFVIELKYLLQPIINDLIFFSNFILFFFIL